ncbi:hypothetical protein MSAN_01639000 [Mycena sanguinolenta]|uniref:Uncharacterized protein n=1 Tax=Mycena sanguinolenta TaxID=230812 RepID=A0A8H6XYQ4_9AGAR|nr:hypothetical protein MSAN_01639000 [Mycena sanguinolenta]
MDDFWFDMTELWVGTFFYGIYLVLFCICIYILLNRPRPGNAVLLVTAIALFTLSTVQAVLNLVLGATEIDYLDLPFDKINRAAEIIYGVTNIIADALVIYRCYIVWDRNVYVIILPLLMLAVTSVFGVDIKLPANPYFSLSLATNVLVTALTAGRIWWICRQCRLYSKFTTAQQKRCMSAIGIIAESGVLYPASILAYLILGAIPKVSIVQEPIYQMMAQIMGIAPTLIIVRVGLGVNDSNQESSLEVKTADLKFIDTIDSDISSQPDLEKGSSWIELQKDVPPIPLDQDVEKGLGRSRSFF